MNLRRSTILGLVLAATAFARSPIEAQRTFHSTQSANLQTTDALRSGNWLFEISHRFQPAVSDGGSDQLWGLDGPIWNRLALSYAPTDGVLMGIQRTNLDDNLELNAKAVVLEVGSDAVRVDLGVMGGIAWNMNPGSSVVQDNETQLYGQVLLNALLGRRFAVGVVPTYLHNPRIQDAEAEDGYAVGVHAQAYLTRSISLLGEWIFSEERPGMENDSGTFGVEFETRGHFFKLLATNQVRMNPTQFLGGTPFPFEPDELRLGFNITRLLPF